MKKLLTILLLQYTFQVYAQQSAGGTPYSFSLVKLKSGTLEPNLPMGQFFLNPVNNEREQLITDSINYHALNKASYYGKIQATDINLLSDTEPIETYDGKLFLYQVFSAGAYGLQFYFDKFHIPEGGKLFIYNEDRDMVLGAFTSGNNNKFNHFATQYIKGGSVFIEYYQPDVVKSNAEIHINNVGHVFKPVFTVADAWGYAEDCHIDVACEESPEWRGLAGSVALILCFRPESNYSYWCSGVLLNNTGNDGRPLFLSASHCADSSRNQYEGFEFERFDYTRWLFMFNYQKENCGDSKAKAYNNSIYGAKVLSKDTAKVVKWFTDHLLLELGLDEDKTKVKETLKKYNAVYAGWDANEGSAWASAYNKSIHHPAGDAKKISTGGMVSQGNINPDEYAGSQWRIEWNQGVTDFGSSGGPLFNDQYKVIGQLYGGGSMCSNQMAADYYSRLSLSYDVGNLGQWLDPKNSDTRSADKLDLENEELIPVDHVYFQYDNITGDGSIFIMEAINNDSKVIVTISNTTGAQVFYNEFDGNNLIHFNQQLATGLYIMKLNYNFKVESRKLFVADY